MPGTISIAELLELPATLLLDAYGVLVDRSGLLPGAPEFLAALEARCRPWFLLTNDSSSLPSTWVERLAEVGLAVREDRMITAGCVLASYFAQHALAGAPSLCLGPPESEEYLRRAGGRLVEPGEEAAVVAVCDEWGYPLVERLDAALTSILARLTAGRELHLVLTNPDLVYPRAGGGVGVTAGAIAALIEAVLADRHPDPPGFVRLGKPFRPIYEEAARRAGTRELVMVGDQLSKDIRGAMDFGIPSVLVESGLDRVDPGSPWQPTWVLPAVGGLG
jgi:HAD superfamily hydrolase (TIGR01450 family)